MKSCCKSVVLLIIATALVAVLVLPGAASVVRVKSDAPGPTHDGQSWATAYLTLQAAISDGNATEVWVAAGSYTGNYILSRSIALYGGFAGTEAERNQRNWSVNETILNRGGASGSVITVTADPIIDGFTIQNGSDTYGGGIYCYSPSWVPTITNNKIINNTASVGGGGIACFGCAPTIAYNTIQGNTAHDGGGIFCTSSASPTVYPVPSIMHNTIQGNRALTGGGGGICCINSDVGSTIAYNTILGNRCTPRDDQNMYSGGGICILDGTCNILNNRLADNHADNGNTSAGGAIAIVDTKDRGSRITIQGNDILDSSADRGGGVWYWQSDAAQHSGVTLASNRIASNNATEGGGMFVSNSADVQLSGNHFISNAATWYGGGAAFFACTAPAAVQMQNDEFIGNRASASFPAPDHAGGGGLYVENSIVGIANATFAGNQATIDYIGGITRGGSVSILESTINIRNTIFYDSVSPDAGKAVYVWAPSAILSRVTLTYSDAYNPGGPRNNGDYYYYYAVRPSDLLLPDSSCFFRDPGLVRTGPTWDARLGAGSPCIDAGTNTGASTTDIEGTARPRIGKPNGTTAICDIGAYEFTHTYLGLAKAAQDGPLPMPLDRLRVTAVFPDYFYAQELDRSSGIRVMKSSTSQPIVAGGDDVSIAGDLDGGNTPLSVERHIHPNANGIVVLSSGNAKPELGMRCRDVGGHSTAHDLGITYPRGPLNVGLYVTVQGMVTYCDTTGASPYFYIWDGTNQVRPGGESQPLFDGNAGGYKGLRIKHSGRADAAVGLSSDLRRWTDFVTIKGVVSVDNTSVPGTVIPVILPTSVTPESESTFDTVTAASGVVLNWTQSLGGYNLMSIPAVPARLGNGVAPADGGLAYPWDPATVFAGVGEASLYRYEDGNLTQYLYDVWAPDAFGGMNPSDGYKVYVTAPWPLSFSGKYQTIPQWYAVENSVPAAAYLWIGQPHNYDSELENVQLSDGSAVYSFRDASQHDDGLKLQWVNSTGFWWNNQEGTQYDVGLWDDWASQTALQPWKGYLFTMNQGSKAWIIP